MVPVFKVEKRTGDVFVVRSEMVNIRFLLLVITTFSTQCIGYHEDDSMKGLFDFFFLEVSDACNCKCGVPNREARLLGGEYTKGHEFPWMAQIQVRDEAKISGTLISNRYILTSASQMIGLTPYDLKITLGQYDRCFPDVSSQILSVESVTLHPDFSPGNRANDLALIKLGAPVKLERRIRPICLPTPGKKYIGQVATVSGWNQGPDASGIVAASCRPRKVGLPVLAHDDCKTTAFNPSFVSDDKACLGIIGTRSVICGTDAGGAVGYRTYSGIYELIGVLSDTNDCSDAPSTSLYTAVNDHMRWIKDMTRDSCFCYKSG